MSLDKQFYTIFGNLRQSYRYGLLGRKQTMSTTSSSAPISSSSKPEALPQARITKRLADFPWWVLILLLISAFLIYSFATNLTYQKILGILIEGIRLTLTITFSAFLLSMIIGLFTAFGQMSKNALVRNIATLYVQIVRGIPALVLIIYVAFVLVPAGVNLLHYLGTWLANQGWLPPDNSLIQLDIRNIDFVMRGIIALAVNYGAFSSEIFRSGIESIEKGQLEASKALGLTWGKTMRLVVLPQAIRRILPPLGNDFISMLKESSLLSVLGVGEITQLGKKYASAAFKYLETYNTVAFLYLSMTLILSMGVKYMEKRLKVGEQES
jgi:polar amino acid transport system permease protein